jgi:hypothetical protein
MQKANRDAPAQRIKVLAETAKVLELVALLTLPPDKLADQSAQEVA